MKFGAKLKKKRREAELTQAELASKIGVTFRTIINYENNNIYPRNREIYQKLADVFDVDVNYFLTEDEEFVTEAKEKYGTNGMTQAQQILAQATALFAGGEMSEDDKDYLVRALQDAYWTAKENNKKFGRRH